MAARDRIMSVWAAMLMLLSLPASLAGLQVGTSGVFGGIRRLGVPSLSLALFCREGVLGESVIWPWLWPVQGVLGRLGSKVPAPGLFPGVDGELRPWMSCSISAACLAKELVFDWAFEPLDWGDVSCEVADGLKSLGDGDVGVDCCCCSCAPTFISFSLFAVTLGISWPFFSVRPSRGLVGVFSTASLLLLSPLSFLVPFLAESEVVLAEVWRSDVFGLPSLLPRLCFLSIVLDPFSFSDFFASSDFG